MLRRKWKIVEKEYKMACCHHHPAAEGVTLPCWHSPDSWGIQQEGWCSPGCGYHWWSLARPSAEGARRNPLREEAVKANLTSVNQKRENELLQLSWLVSHRSRGRLDWFPASERAHTHTHTLSGPEYSLVLSVLPWVSVRSLFLVLALLLLSQLTW